MGNALTITDIETLPLNLSNEKFYSSFDLKETFYEVELARQYQNFTKTVDVR